MARKATTAAKAKTTRKAKPAAKAKTTRNAKPAAKAKAAAKAKRPTASAAQPRRRRVVGTTTFRRGKQGSIFRMDVKTKPVGKVITAKVGGKVKAIAISR